MKKNFVTGLLSGLCGALIIFTIVGTVYVKQVAGKTLNDPKDQVENQETDTKEQPFQDVVEKLSVLEMIVDNYFLEETDPNAFAEGIYKGFMSSLKDPYSTYYTKEEYTALMESSSGVYCGIGAVVSQNAESGIITIVKPYKDSPAYKAGLLPGDIIYKVEGEEVTGVDLSEVVSKIKGVEGTAVKMSVVREDQNEPIELDITRKEIEVPTIEYKMLDNKIGYIIISEFDEITVGQFKAAVNDLLKQDMKGLVIDLRNNPGGLLDSVVNMLDRLLPKGLIVYTEDKYGKRVEENAVNDDKVEVPMAVIINGNSASASEIFAGAVQDYKIGTIVGTTSFGKGIVQKVIPLSDGTAVKLTISKYFTPKGRNIHGTGIEPDVKVDLKDDLKKEIVIPVEKDNQLQEAIKSVMGQMK
ncbi:MAG: hypothetical protein K0S47_767 [Herbinix sp.]|jgi:carboxyl-terminal processing protease|nr:hypothetical protein [Herbinix sp.]